MCYFEFSLNLWGKETKTGTEVWGIYVFVACLKVSSGNKFDFKNLKQNRVKNKIGFHSNVPWVCKNCFKTLSTEKIKTPQPEYQAVFKEENVNVGSTVLTEGVTQHPDSGTNKIKSPADLGRCKPKI